MTIAAAGYDDLGTAGSEVIMDPSKVRLEDLITRKEFLELLEVGPSRLTALRDDPDMPEPIKWGRSVMWDRAEATAYAKARKEKIAERAEQRRQGKDSKPTPSS